MCDIEKQIADWRATMARPAGCREALLDELEEQLREEIEHLRRSGIPAGDVFERAVSKLGAPGPVGAEFANLASNGRVWMPVKIARILVGTMAAALVPAALLLPNSRGVLLLSHAWCVTLGYSIMFTIGGLSIYDVCARWFGEPRRAQRESLLRAIFQFADL